MPAVSLINLRSVGSIYSSSGPGDDPATHSISAAEPSAASTSGGFRIAWAVGPSSTSYNEYSVYSTSIDYQGNSLTYGNSYVVFASNAPYKPEYQFAALQGSATIEGGIRSISDSGNQTPYAIYTLTGDFSRGALYGRYDVSGGAGITHADVTALASGGYVIAAEGALTVVQTDFPAGSLQPISPIPSGDYVNGTSTVQGLAGGNFALAWTTPNDSSGSGVRVEVFDHAGNPLPSGIVSPNLGHQAGDQGAPHLAALTNGRFVVAYDDAGAGGHVVRAALYAPDGTGLADLDLSGGQTGVAAAAIQDLSVTGLANGWFAAVYTRALADGTKGVFGGVWNADGLKVGAEFAVSGGSTGIAATSVLHLDVAAGGSAFIVDWANAAGDIQVAIFQADRAPVAGNDGIVVTGIRGPAVGVSSSSSVFANDGDPDGDGVVVMGVRGAGGVQTLPAGGSAIAQGTYGHLVLGADGAFTYIVDDASGVSEGAMAHDVFTYTIADPSGLQASATLDVTLVGGDGAVTILGCAGDDLLYGGAYADRINAGAGADTVVAGGGDDIVFGEDGNDNLNGGAGDDFVGAGAGNDLMFGNEGNDHLYGEDGQDTLYGGVGLDTLEGGEGNDQLFAQENDDRVYAGDGDDYVDGGAGNDILFGEVGSDNLNGGAGDDFVGAGAGADTVFGNEGNDNLFGEGGNDALYGGVGLDTISGGDGNDYLTGQEDDDRLLGGDGDDAISGGAGNDIVFGENGNDLLFGDEGDDFIGAGAGNDQLYGGAGNDRMFGEDGNDVLWGNAGNDTMTGGAGRDEFHFGHYDGQDVITDFTAGNGLDHDVIALSLGSFQSFDQVLAASQQVGNDVVLTYTAGDTVSVTLQNVQLSSLTQDDFVFQ